MTGAQHSQGKPRVKFKDPPVNELVVAVYHLPITELRAQHIGLYWRQIYGAYPICEQQSPIVGAEDDAAFRQMPGEIFPLPRFWFRSGAHSMLIQVQRNAFILNWRRQQNSEYPHYEKIEEAFWKEFETYKRFIQETVAGKLDVVSRCELTYINMIAKNEFFTGGAKIMSVVPPVKGLCELDNPERQLVGLNALAVYKINDQLRIDVTPKLGRRRDKTQEEVALLEIKAHGSPADLSFSGAHDWYRMAHESTYETFLALTDERARKQLWKPL